MACTSSTTRSSRSTHRWWSTRRRRRTTRAQPCAGPTSRPTSWAATWCGSAAVHSRTRSSSPTSTSPQEPTKVDADTGIVRGRVAGTAPPISQLSVTTKGRTASEERFDGRRARNLRRRGREAQVHRSPEVPGDLQRTEPRADGGLPRLLRREGHPRVRGEPDRLPQHGRDVRRRCALHRGPLPGRGPARCHRDQQGCDQPGQRGRVAEGVGRQRRRQRRARRRRGPQRSPTDLSGDDRRLRHRADLVGDLPGREPAWSGRRHADVQRRVHGQRRRPRRWRTHDPQGHQGAGGARGSGREVARSCAARPSGSAGVATARSGTRWTAPGLAPTTARSTTGSSGSPALRPCGRSRSTGRATAVRSRSRRFRRAG